MRTPQSVNDELNQNTQMSFKALSPAHCCIHCMISACMDVEGSEKLCHYQPGEISLLLELLLHFAANLPSRVIDFAYFGEEGSNLVASQKSSCSSLQQVTQTGLNGS